MNQQQQQAAPKLIDEAFEKKLNISKRFKLIKKLGTGAFGEIYQAINLKNNLEIAIKLEPTSSKHPQLLYETNIYKYLLSDTNVFDKGIPQVYFCQDIGAYNMMVMDLLGPSLEEQFNRCGRKFTLKTTLMIALQMLSRIEYVQSRTFIHRDIKPDNFAVGIGKRANKIFILDFGLAKRYIQKDNSHIPYKDGKHLTGTARYASLNTHLGIEQARRDDLESMVYIMIYFLKGILPWQNLRAKNKYEKYAKIKEKKQSITVDQLTLSLPLEINQMLKYCRAIAFEEKPDYAYLNGLILQMMKKNQFENDYLFDWIDVEKKVKVQESLQQEIKKVQN